MLGWLAVLDAAAAAVLAGLIYLIGRRSRTGMTIGSAVGLAILLGLPAAALYLAVWLMWHSI